MEVKKLKLRSNLKNLQKIVHDTEENCDIHLFAQDNEDGGYKKISFHSALLGSFQHQLRDDIYAQNPFNAYANYGQLHLILDQSISSQDVEKFLHILYDGIIPIDIDGEAEHLTFLADLFKLGICFENVKDEMEDPNANEVKVGNVKGEMTLLEYVDEDVLETFTKGKQSQTKNVKRKRNVKIEPKEQPVYFMVNGEKYHRDSLGFGCPYCKKSWTTNSKMLRLQLPKHITRHHSEINENEIDSLVKSLPNLYDSSEWEGHPLLRVHEWKTFTEPKFLCPHGCEKKFSLLGQLKEHLLLNHNGDKMDNLENLIDMRPYKCHLCPRACTNPQKYQEHLKEHTNIDWTCEICGKSFKTQNRLKDHRQQHNDAKRCKECGTYVKSKGALMDHMNLHTGLKPHSCEPCQKSFSTKSGIRRHNDYHHKERRDFQCETCLKCFYSKNKLQDHLDAVHLKVKRHACDKCEYKCANSANLYKHKRFQHSEPEDGGMSNHSIKE